MKLCKLIRATQQGLGSASALIESDLLKEPTLFAVLPLLRASHAQNSNNENLQARTSDRLGDRGSRLSVGSPGLSLGHFTQQMLPQLQSLQGMQLLQCTHLHSFVLMTEKQ